jgi:hypothetical protein
MNDELMTAAPVTREALVAAADVCCCRFGNAEGEARRRGRATALVRSARELAAALERYAAATAAHGRGIHNTPDMAMEANEVADAFAAWSFSVAAAARLRSECMDAGLAHDAIAVLPSQISSA